MAQHPLGAFPGLGMRVALVQPARKGLAGIGIGGFVAQADDPVGRCVQQSAVHGALGGAHAATAMQAVSALCRWRRTVISGLPVRVAISASVKPSS